MSKGFYTQGLAVLFHRTPSLDDLEAALSPSQIVERAGGSSEWAFGGPSIIIPFRPEVNGYTAIDIVPVPWPDGMGEPKRDPILFGAWSMGQFGPFTFPGGLERSIEQAWHWPEARDVVAGHSSFVRIRTSYVFGAEMEAPILPAEYAPLSELLFATEVAEAVLSVLGALCYFNPNGECLYPGDEVSRLLSRHRTTGPAALELWSNVRMFTLPVDSAWLLMDTVGMAQLDVPDHEACFARNRYEAPEVARFLRTAADYVLEHGPIIEDGDTMDGPGGLRWQGATFEPGIANPPRTVIRWLPMDDTKRPPGIQGEA